MPTHPPIISLLGSEEEDKEQQLTQPLGEDTPQAAGPISSIANLAPQAGDEEPGIIPSLGKGFAHGVTGLAESVGTGIEYLGGKFDNQDMIDLGDTIESYWQDFNEKNFEAHESLQGSIYDREDGWDTELLTKGAWWAYNVASIIPSFAASMIPGAAVAKGAAALSIGAKVLKWTPSVASKMGRLGRFMPHTAEAVNRGIGAAAGGFTGGTLEGANTYNEVMEKGGTREEAEAAAEQMTAATMALNMLSINQMLKKMPPGLLSNAARRIVNGLTEGITEWLEGPAEAGIMLRAAGKDGSDIRFTPEEAVKKIYDELNVLPPSVITGMMFGGGGPASVEQGRDKGPLGTAADKIAGKMLPLSEDGAVRRAEMLTRQGQPHSVVPHPQATGKFAVVPIDEDLFAEQEMAEQEPTEVTTNKQVDDAAHEAATSPENDLEVTQEQLESGDYPKGRFTMGGDTFSIENPEGSIRKGIDETGKEWEQEITHHYGDWDGTIGADGDPIDVFFGRNPKSKKAFVVNQVNPNTGEFDEHKVMRAFDSKEEAETAYLSNYEDGWQGLGNIVEASVEEVRKWAESGDTSKPFTLGEGVKKFDMAPAEWTKESVAVDEGGELLTMYHGSKSTEQINEFDPEMDFFGQGFTWFTPSKQYANRYAMRGFKGSETGIAVGKKKGHVVPVNLNIKNPLYGTSDKARQLRSELQNTDAKFKDILLREGYDAYIPFEKEGTPISKANEVAILDQTAVWSTKADRQMLKKFDQKGEYSEVPEQAESAPDYLSKTGRDGEVKRFDSHTEYAGPEPIKLGKKKKDPKAAKFNKDFEKLGDRNPFMPSEMVIMNPGGAHEESGAAIEAGVRWGELHIASIRSFRRGEGNASYALNKVLELADKHGLTINMTPSPFGKGTNLEEMPGGKMLTKKQLEKWYGRHGFVKGDEPGKFSQMIREPQGKLKKFDMAPPDVTEEPYRNTDGSYRKNQKGDITGAPKGVKDDSGIAAIVMKNVKRLIGMYKADSDRAKASANWYEVIGAELRRLSKDPAILEKMIRMLARFSANAQVGTNLTFTMKGAYQLVRGEEVMTGRFPSKMRPEIKAILEADEFNKNLAGVKDKVMNFYRNLYDATFQTDKYEDAITMDMWMAKLYEYKANAKNEYKLGDAQYRFANMLTDMITAEFNKETGRSLSRRQIQAALWGFARDAEDSAKGKRRRNILSFATYIRRATAHITAEAVTSKKAPFFRTIHKAPIGIRKAYTNAAMAVTMDGERDLLLEAIAGIPLYGSEDSMGTFEESVNPNRVIDVVMDKDDGIYNRDDVSLYALAMMYIHSQDAVPWFRFTTDAAIMKVPTGGSWYHGVTIGFTAKPDAATVELFYTHLREHVQGAEFSVIGNDAVVVNYGRVNNKKFIKDIKDAAETFNFGGIKNGFTEITKIKAESEYNGIKEDFGSSWATPEEAIAILEREILKRNRPDILERVRGWRGDVGKVQSRFERGDLKSYKVAAGATKSFKTILSERRAAQAKLGYVLANNMREMPRLLEQNDWKPAITDYTDIGESEHQPFLRMYEDVTTRTSINYLDFSTETYRQADTDESKVITAAIRDLMDVGLPARALQFVKEIGIFDVNIDNPTGASFVPMQTVPNVGEFVNSVWINSNTIDVVMKTKDPTASKGLRSHLIHEIGHAIDVGSDPDKLSHTRDSRLFRINPWGYHRKLDYSSPIGYKLVFKGKPFGPVMMEAVEFFQSDEAKQNGMQDLLAYPLVSLYKGDGNGTLMIGSKAKIDGELVEITETFRGEHPFHAANFEDQVTAEVWRIQGELFAQLHDIFYTMPEEMAKHLPKGYALMQEVQNATAQEATLTGLNRRLREILRTPSTKLSPNWTQQRFWPTKPADKSVEGQRAGEGVEAAQRVASAVPEQGVTGEQGAEQWAGDTVVRDKDGSLLEVYHGTDADFDVMEAREPDTFAGSKKDLKGIYFTADSSKAYAYAKPSKRRSAGGAKPKVIRAHLKILKPLNITGMIKYRRKQKGMSFGEAKQDAMLKFDPAKYDGIVFDGDAYNSAEYIVFDSSQVKSTDGGYDASTPNIWKTQNVKNSPSFRSWFGNSKVVDKNGDPLEIYHGTTHDFDEFSTTYATPESYMGAGYYFTDSEEDVNANYAGEGPDLTNRIESEAEMLRNTDDALTDFIVERYDLEWDEAQKKRENMGAEEMEWFTKELAKQRLGVENQGTVMPVFVKMENPVEIEPKGGTMLIAEWDTDYYKGDGMAKDEVDIDDYTDEDGDIDEGGYNEAIEEKARDMFFEDYNPELTGNAADMGNIIRAVAYEYGADGAALQQSFMEEFDFPFGMATRAYDFSEWLRSQEDLYDAVDDEGNITSNDMLREIFERMGFDGVIMDAEAHFGPRQIKGAYGNVLVQGMDGVYGAKHYVAFHGEQIKSSIGNTGDYSPNPNITMSNKGKSFGREAAAVQADVDTITEAWSNAPDIKTISHRSMLPQRLQKEALRTRGRVEGVYDSETNTVYMVADTLPTTADVHRVLLHEVFGHWAVGQAYGKDFEPLLELVASSYGNKLQGIAERHGVSLTTREGRLIAAQEQMAELAELGTNPTLLNKLILKFKQILNNLGFKVKLTNADLKTILAAAGTMVYEGDSAIASGKLVPVFSQQSTTFYSQMQEHLAQKLPNKGKAGQMKLMINNMAKKGQFKKEELEWSGVNEWLDEQTGTVTKDQVLEFLRENAIEIEEVTLGGTPMDEDIDMTLSVDTSEAIVFDGDTEGLATYEAGDGYIYEARGNQDTGWALYDERSRIISDEEGQVIVDDIDDMEQYALTENAKRLREWHGEKVTDDADGPAKFEGYTEKGEKSGYRELLLRMPPKDTETERRPVSRAEGAEIIKNGGELDAYFAGSKMVTVSNQHGFNRILKREDITGLEHIIKRGKTADRFTGAHYDEHSNILAHIRFDTRTDADGKKVLFIEEVQSDWHQKGREKGYKKPDSNLPTSADVVNGYNKVKPVMKQEDYLGFDDLRQSIDAIMIHDDYAERWEISTPENAAIIAEYKRLRIAYEGTESTRGTRELVADAPFKTGWPMLAMKRMIRYAAENNFDRIAWTTGEQQADRYDLSKQVSSIEGAKYGVGKIQLTIRDLEGSKVDMRVFESGNDPAITEYIGKDLAKKISEENGVGEWRGLDLKVGGEGMTTFYDKMLPSMVGKYIKKWGGKVGSTTIEAGNKAPSYGLPPIVEFEENRLDGESIGDYTKRMRETGKTSEQHSIDMTPQMREAAMDGQVLFSATDEQATRTIKQQYADRADKILKPLRQVMSPIGKLPFGNKYIGMRQGVMGKISKINQVVKRIHDILSELTGDELVATYNYLTKRNAIPEGIPDREIVIKRGRGTGRLLQKAQAKNLRREVMAIKRLINATGKELVDRGLIPQESYEHYADKYLPRLYLAHLLKDDDFNAVVGGQGKKVSPLGYTKGRNEDLSEVYRILKGEIKNPAYLASKTVGTSLRDIAILDFLNEISKVKEWILPNLMVEWSGSYVSAEWLRTEGNRILGQAQYQDERDAKVSRIMGAEMIEKGQWALDHAGYEGKDYNDYRQVPNMPRYGSLKGVWVRQEIYDDLIGGIGAIHGDSFMESLLGSGGIGTKITQLWKMSKVALNPPSQVRNFVSNLIMASLHGGIPMHKIPGLLHRAFKEVKNNGKYWRYAQREGVESSTFTANELFRIDRDLLKLKKQAGQLSTWENILMVAGVIGEYAGDMYQFSEAIGKTMMMIHGIEVNKLTPREAAVKANDTLFDYSFVGKNVKYLRNAPVGMPFITFYYKALPNMVEVALKHPQRFAPYLIIPALIAQAIAKSHDVDDDDVEALKEALPNWVRERGAATILPVKDARGRWQAFDYGYFLPWGMFTDIITDVSEGHVGEAVKTSGLFGRAYRRTEDRQGQLHWSQDLSRWRPSPKAVHGYHDLPVAHGYAYMDN